MTLVAKIPSELNDIGPAESSPETLAITLKVAIPNTMKKMVVKPHSFMTFKDLNDNSVKTLFVSI